LITAVGQALREKVVETARGLIPPLDELDEEVLSVREVLLAIIGGSRDPSLALDARVDCVGAVEIALILESLAGSGIPE